jgi:hypothetical protein
VVDLIVLENLVLGSQFAIAFRNAESGFSFVGKSLTLVLDHATTGTRIKFTEAGCFKTVDGATTTLDTTPVVISDSNQRASWTRNVAFVLANFLVGEWTGYFWHGPATSSKDAWARIQLTVEQSRLGPP